MLPNYPLCPAFKEKVMYMVAAIAVGAIALLIFGVALVMNDDADAL